MNNNTLFTTNGVTDSNRVLHTPGDFAKKNLLYVQEIGELKSLQPHKSQRENLDSFLLLGVLNGEGTVTIGEDNYKIKKGNCAFINCMDYYAHESDRDNPWELMWVHFNGNTAKAYFDLFMEHNDSKGIFKPTNLNTLRGNIMTLMGYQKEKDLKSELLSGSLLADIINSCLFSVMHQGVSHNDEYGNICKEIREYVNEKFREDKLMATLADKYDIDEEKLDLYFKKKYGITLRDYILNRRFTAAKELLRFTVMPINDIVVDSGIRNDDLFRKLFMDGENMTAAEYRMKWSQWVK